MYMCPQWLIKKGEHITFHLYTYKLIIDDLLIFKFKLKLVYKSKRLLKNTLSSNFSYLLIKKLSIFNFYVLSKTTKYSTYYPSSLIWVLLFSSPCVIKVISVSSAFSSTFGDRIELMPRLSCLWLKSINPSYSCKSNMSSSKE